MKVLGFIAALGLSFAVELQAQSCFCKVLCFWDGEDSSDFYKVVDVSCDLSVEQQKGLSKETLMKHVKDKHAGYGEVELKQKTEIVCYKSEAAKSQALKSTTKKK